MSCSNCVHTAYAVFIQTFIVDQWAATLLIRKVKQVNIIEGNIQIITLLEEESYKVNEITFIFLPKYILVQGHRIQVTGYRSQDTTILCCIISPETEYFKYTLNMKYNICLLDASKAFDGVMVKYLILY